MLKSDHTRLYRSLISVLFEHSAPRQMLNASCRTSSVLQYIVAVVIIVYCVERETFVAAQIAECSNGTEIHFQSLTVEG